MSEEESYDDIYMGPTLSSLRLRWQIREGPIWQNIHCLDDPCDPTSTQRPFQNELGQLHEAAAHPLSEDDLESFTVKIAGLDKAWQRQERGREIPALEFNLGQDEEFFTLGDFVLRVHPWLLSLRQEILRDIPRPEGSGPEWPSSTDLWVNPCYQNPVSFLSSASLNLEEAWTEVTEAAQAIKFQMEEEDANLKKEEAKPSPSLDFLRLRWEVRQGAIRDRVHVLQDVEDQNSEQEPFQTEAGAFHEIAGLALTMTPISELRVAIVVMQRDTGTEDSGTEDSGAEDLTTEITIIPGDDRSFISIKDFVLGAYDWLVSWRPLVLKNYGMYKSGVPWPAETQLWLNPLHIDCIDFFEDKTQVLDSQWKIVAILGPAERREQQQEPESYEYVPKYPTELLPDSHFADKWDVWPSLAFLRLRWIVAVAGGSLGEDISVLDDVYNPKSATKPFQDENGHFHEIAALPFSRPPRQALQLTIDRLDGLQSWKQYTEEDLPRVRDPDSAPKLSVVAGEGREFISVGDYVAQVHPWLLSLRRQLIKELGLTESYMVWEDDTELWIDPTSPGIVMFYTNREGEEELQGEWDGVAEIASQG